MGLNESKCKSNIELNNYEKHFARSFNEDDIEFNDCVGHGSFGTVMVGYFKPIENNKQTIAIKQTKKEHSQITKNEIEILAKIRHKNIVHLYGSYESDEGLNIIFELVEKGNLSRFVQEWEVPNKDLLNIALDIASGMVYLHEMDILHMDLAARNILLDSKHRAKVSDFGFSSQTESDHFGLPLHNHYYYQWMPKESMPIGNVNPHFSKYSDVWSFGVILWEMWSREQRPYGDKLTQEVLADIMNGKNPISIRDQNGLFPPELKKLRKLIKTRIFVKEEFRLSFAQLKVRIQNVIKTFPNDNPDLEEFFPDLLPEM